MKMRKLAAAFLLAATSMPFATISAWAQTAAATPAPRPVEDFAELPFMSDPELSPDGTRVATKLSIGGQQVLAIMSLFDKDARPAIISGGNNDLNSWKWVNDNWLVIGLGAVHGVEGSDWYLSRIAGVSADGKTIKPIAFRDAAQDADDVLWVADDGTPRLLLALQTSIYSNLPGFWPSVLEVDVSTGRTKRRLDGREGVMSWYVDGTGAVRMGVGYSDTTRASRLLYRDSDDRIFRTVDRADGRKDERLTVPALFLAEPGKALAWGEEDGRDALRKLDLATLELGEKVFSVPGYDLDGLVANRTRNGLAGVRYTDMRQRVHWFDPALARVQADLDKAVGADRTAEILSFSRDQQKMLVLVGGPDRPGAYYFYDIAVGTMQRFANVSSKLKGRYAPVGTIRYKARDGLEIPAILTLPAGREAKNLPLIVMPHGGPAVRDDERWDWHAQFLADRGYAVIQPNYRGSIGYGTAFREKGDGEWGLKMQDDLNDAITHLAKQGMVDAKRVCMVGSSYGGYAAMRAAQRDGTLYRCAVSFAGVSDLSHLARYDRNRFLYGRTYQDSLKEKAPDFAAVSPINFPAQFSAPILLVHGKKDLRVPVKQSREMAEKLRKAGKPVRYVEQPLGDHHFSREEDRVQFLKELEAFLKQYNPA